MNPRDQKHNRGGAERSLVTPALTFAGLWWVIAGGNAASWLVGLPAVVAAVWAHHALRRGARVRVSPAGFLRFVPYFLWESLRGGVDVARRTLRPRLRVRPTFVHYRVGLTGPVARVFFANAASLIPGTLTVEFVGDELEIHMLSDDPNIGAELNRLELMVAALFGE